MRQKKTSVALLCAVTTAWAAPTAGAASSPITPVSSAIKTAAPKLSKSTKTDLNKRLSRAKAAYGRHQWCVSVRELGGIATKTGHLKGTAATTAKPVHDAAVVAQQKVFKAHAKQTGYCGLPAPKVKVSGGVKPSVKSIPNPSGGAPLPVSAVQGEHAKTDFVANEVVVLSNDAAKVEAFAKRWHGKVVDHSEAKTPDGKDAWRVQVDPSAIDTAGVTGDLRAIDPLARGTLKVSDGDGLDLIALAADAARDGLQIAPNFLVNGSAVEDRTTSEQPGSGGGWSPDADQLWYNAPGGSIKAGEAWRTLRIAGKDKSRVKVAVVDGGFRDPQNDIAGQTGNWGGPQNAMQCTGGNPCPFHGSNVSSTLGGIVDNGAGVAGSGGQVADVQAVQLSGGTEFDAIDGVYTAFEAGAKVINISSGYGLDAIVSVFNVPYEDATQTAREHGALVVASAGNDGKDVDAEDCFIVCWEETWIAPCENDAVVCVGGVNGDDRKRANKSNYGYEWTSYAPTSDVDIFGPWCTWVAADGAVNNVHNVCGTSFSSPFVAGVAADMLAANPSLTPQQLEQGLKDTASNSSDKFVSRVVNADSAVKWAFNGKHIGPLVKITTKSGTEYPYGGFGGNALDAKVYKLYDNDPACCNVVWNSPEDGFLGNGASIQALFSSPGERTVTATASDNQGGSSSDSIKITATNDAPVLTVSTPAPGATLYAGIDSKFLASATDFNEPGGIACASIHWKVTGTALPTQELDGCTPTFKFVSTGQRTLNVVATDKYGRSYSTTRNFNVVPAPLNVPPLVTILDPDEGQSFFPGDTMTLHASATDPDNSNAPMTGTWSVKYNGSTTVLGAGVGTTNALSWKPSDNIPFGCGGNSGTVMFSATNGHGTTTKQVTVNVLYGPC